MKNISKNITMLCPRCGNKLFSSLDVDSDELRVAPGTARVKCSDCGLIITKEELENENALVINNAIDETVEEVKKQFIKEIKKRLK